MINKSTIRHLSFCILLLASLSAQAQKFDILLVDGHVFDAKNQVDEVLDVAIKDGKIVKLGTDLPEEEAEKVIDVSGMYVCPGLIDIHTHVFVGSNPGFADGFNSLSPDDFTFKAGITTVVDAGTSGWRNFPKFRTQVIDRSKTRVLAHLNIAGSGISGNPGQEDLKDMDVSKTAQTVRENSDIIVGIKIGHYTGDSWEPFNKALAAADQSDVPLFVECHLPQYTLEDQLDRMRPGDIITHSYEKVSERMPVTDDDGKVRPFVIEAKEKGIFFDVGHGGAGFWFSVAIPALEQGLWPNSFGTDLHRFSMNAGMKDMLNVMSKYVAMGMPVKEVLTRGTWYPAKSIKRDDLGHLGVGAEADIAVLRLKKGKFGFVDAGKNVIEGDSKFEAELTLRAGKIVWDLNGISAKKFVY